ncbi:MAG: hypothetical protein H6Q38_2321, partial [Chloroflexi bacterium]|nr:hypothetical protein [Chloroflexota bacterium]
ETPDMADLRNLYIWLGKAYELSDQIDKALAIRIEMDSLGYEI